MTIAQQTRPYSAVALARWFAGLLWLALALLDLSLYSIRQDPPNWSSVHPVIMHLSLWSLAHGAALGQVAIMCVAIVWTRVNLAVRLGATGLCLWGLAHIVSVPRAIDVPHYFGTLVLYCFMMLIPLVITRMCGLSFIFVQREPSTELANCDESSASPPGRPDWQFSMWDLLSITTAIAIATGVLQFADFRDPAILKWWPYFLLHAYGALTTVGTVLYAWPSVRSAFIAVSPLTLIIIGCSFGFSRRTGDSGVVMDLIANCTVAGAAALVMRIAGLRIAWRSCKDTGSERQLPILSNRSDRSDPSDWSNAVQ